MHNNNHDAWCGRDRRDLNKHRRIYQNFCFLFKDFYSPIEFVKDNYDFMPFWSYLYDFEAIFVPLKLLF